MRWRGERQSTNIEDRRGMSIGRVAVGGGLGTIVIMILALLFGINPQQLFEQLPSDQPGVQSSRPTSPEEEELKQFVGVVLAKSKMFGPTCFVRTGGSIESRRSCSLTIECSLRVESPALLLGHSIVRVMKRFTSISRFTNNSDASSRRREILRRLTWSRGRLGITCRSF